MILKRAYILFLSIHFYFIVQGQIYPYKTKNSLAIDSLIDWTGYPGYYEYVNFMNNCTIKYPNLCKLGLIDSSLLGKEILVLKISDNASDEEDEPNVFYTSTMHGNEVTGYYLMIRLIDYLLTQYDSSSLVKELVNNIQIYINPLSNPDGTYGFSTEDIVAPIRFNSQGIDLNRNFPLLTGNSNDPVAYETQGMVNFMNSRPFVLSANFHGGAEVVNYPWDVKFDLHPDNDWFIHISKEYADTVITYSQSGYFQDISTTGYTNGAEWYVIDGGRQDYVNYFLSIREVTIELSNSKTPLENELPLFWEYHYRSLLNYIKQSLYGIHGKVLKYDDNSPVQAKITILNHDEDFSSVKTTTNFGGFFRPIYKGTYDVIASANGYISDTIYNVVVNNNQVTKIEFHLVPDNSKINSIENISNNKPIKIIQTPYGIEVINLQDNETIQFICIYDINGRLLAKQKKLPMLLQNLKSGIYFISIATNTNIYTQKIVK